jgi:hypothetical protein
VRLLCFWRVGLSAEVSGIPVAILSIRKTKGTRAESLRKKKSGPKKADGAGGSGRLRTVRLPDTQASISAKQARENVENLVRQEAPAMTLAIINAVKRGQFAQMKYLFEVSGIYPSGEEGHEDRGESVTARLLRELDERKEAAMRRGNSGAGTGTAKESVP